MMPFPGGPSSLRILKNSNYRKYFIGQLISMSGTWMQSVAQSLLVFHITKSGYWLGAISFMGQLPAFLASPVAGIVADHADRRKILVIVQIVEMVQALLLAALVFSGKVQLWHVAVLACGLGVVNAFDMTTRHAFAVDMVGKNDLSNAIALNSVLINVARVFGPSLAGILVSAVGEAWCFLLNGVSYLPVIWGLMTMTIQVHRKPRSTINVLSNISEGVRYVRGVPVIFRILILSTFVCLIACPYLAILPVFAEKVLGGGPETLGWLTGMLGMGAVTAALLFTGTSDPQILRKRMSADVIFWGIGLITLGTSKNLWLSLGAMFTIGYFMMSLFPTMNNAIQQLVDDSMRGRVMSLYTMTFTGTVPLGSLAIGWLSDRFTASRVVAWAGLLTMLLGLGLAVRNTLRHRLREIIEGIKVT